MSFSSSCSSKRWAGSAGAAVALVLLLGLTGCRHAKPQPPPPLRLAVFPVQNAAGGNAPIRALTQKLDTALAARGLDIVPRAELDVVLARHRIRFTGGIDGEVAKVLREQLGVDAVLVPTLGLYGADVPPRMSLAVRIVSTTRLPLVLWADEIFRAGNDSPGLLALGVVNSPGRLEDWVVDRAVARVARWVEKRGGAAQLCGAAGRFKPRRTFRAPVLDDVGRRSIAVLPFMNGTSRRQAGDVILNQFVSQLTRSGSFEVIDPGAVREELLSHRIVLQGGVSIDHAMALLDLLQADFVLSGYVQVYEARSGKQGPPRVEFTAYILDRQLGEVVWSSASTGAGDDGVWFFGRGTVHTSSELSCRMVRGVVDRIVGDRGPLGESR